MECYQGSSRGQLCSCARTKDLKPAGGVLGKLVWEEERKKRRREVRDIESWCVYACDWVRVCSKDIEREGPAGSYLQLSTPSEGFFTILHFQCEVLFTPGSYGSGSYRA